MFRCVLWGYFWRYFCATDCLQCFLGRQLKISNETNANELLKMHKMNKMHKMQMSCTRCTRSTICTSAVCREPENLSTIHSLSITSLHSDAEGCTTGGDLSELLNLQLDMYFWSWFSSLDFLCWTQESNPMDPSIGIQSKRPDSIESARHQTGSESLQGDFF